MEKRRQLALTVACLAPALLPGIALAGSIDGQHGQPVVFGSVTSVGSGNFTLSTASGSVVVDTTAHTSFVAHSSQAAIAGFQQGDAVLATGNLRKSFTAQKVQYDVVPFAVSDREYNFSGTYAGSSSTQLTITRPDGSPFSINVGPGTRYVENGRHVNSPSYGANDKIVIQAGEFTDGHLWAVVVTIGGKKHR